MKIQLLHPPVLFNVRSLTALRPSPPLGLAYIAAALRSAGHEVSVLDAVAEGVDRIVADGRLHRMGLGLEQIVARIDPQAEIIGVSNMWSFAWPLVRSILQAIRARHPDKILIAGGEHFTGLPVLSLNTAPLDYIVLGEGEDTVTELLATLAIGGDVAQVDGIAYRLGNQVQITPARTRKRALDELAWPAWDLFRLDLYNRHSLIPGLKSGFSVPILATRGCPYQCTYCSSPSMWTTQWYARDPARVVDEIEHCVRSFAADDFPFQDLTAILRRDWILRFCAELERRNLKVQWQFPSGTRCEVVDDEVAAALHRTGGRHLAFAPESGSEDSRRRIKKQMSTDKLMGAVGAAVRNQLSLACFFVLGFPDDTADDVKDTLRLARRLARAGVSDIAVGYFFPIPNTELFHRLVHEGRIVVDDAFLRTPMYANDPFLKSVNNYSNHLPAWRLSFAKHWIVANFYAISFALRPWRLARVLYHVVRGRETMKLESFLIELKRKTWIWIETVTARRNARRTAPTGGIAKPARRKPREFQNSNS